MLLEDDIEVSMSFYGWLKYTLLTFRHGRQSARDPRLLGVSLYTQRLEELARPPRRLTHYATLGGRPFAQQLPCSWGALYFPEHWRRFRAYQVVRTFESYNSSQVFKKLPNFADPATGFKASSAPRASIPTPTPRASVLAFRGAHPRHFLLLWRRSSPRARRAWPCARGRIDAG